MLKLSLLTRYERYFPLFLAILSLPLFFYYLGQIALIGPDEPRFAQVAREMYQSRDFISPRLAGHLWFEKPALLYWLMAASYSLFGVSEFAARLPSALSAVLGVLAIYFTGRRASGPLYGLLSASVLATSVIYFSFARGASFDMLFTLTITLAFCCFFLSEIVDRKRRGKYLIGFYAAVGLSVLAKGLIGIVIAGGVIGLYLFITGQLKKVFKLRLLSGLAVFLAVCAIWYAPVILRHGQQFIQEFFIEHHFQRYTTNKYHHPGPVYYYIVVIFAGMFPWSFFLLPAIARLRRLKLRDAAISLDVRLQIFTLSWILFPLAFFSFSTSKLPGYILPAVPAIALFIGRQVKALWEGEWDEYLKVSSYLTPLLVMLLAGVALFFPAGQFRVSNQLRHILMAPPLALGSLLLLFYFLRRIREAIVALTLGMAVFAAALVTLTADIVSEAESFKTLSQTIVSEMRPGEKVLFFLPLPREVHSITFYADQTAYYDEEKNGLGLEELITEMRKVPSALCLVEERNLDLILANHKLRAYRLGKQHKVILLRVTLIDRAAP